MASTQTEEQQARLAAEHDLHVEMLPGTEILTDIGNTHRIHAHNVAESTVLIPQPSLSPDDPLVIHQQLQDHDSRLTGVPRTGVVNGRL